MSDKEDDKEYPVADENGQLYAWFEAGIADYWDGVEPDLGRAIGKHLQRHLRKTRKLERQARRGGIVL